jgi:hypothetical protein
MRRCSPQEMHRLQLCVAAAKHMHPAIAELLPAILLAGAAALAAQRRTDPLRTLVAFASSVDFRVPQPTFQELNRLYNSISFAQ